MNDDFKRRQPAVITSNRLETVTDQFGEYIIPTSAGDNLIGRFESYVYLAKATTGRVGPQPVTPELLQITLGLILIDRLPKVEK